MTCGTTAQFGHGQSWQSMHGVRRTQFRGGERPFPLGCVDLRSQLENSLQDLGDVQPVGPRVAQDLDNVRGLDEADARRKLALSREHRFISTVNHQRDRR